MRKHARDCAFRLLLSKFVSEMYTFMARKRDRNRERERECVCVCVCVCVSVNAHI